uniref:WGS project CAEQ00000000 data, annotated contig 2383 n=1 Tax=Trypanosoma congolense (strain IL3000) TaxID=1068625 RepID=F9WDM9_TRYCI|nr:unnamed protein product [Trypanosoma congolense IL3000]
MLKNMIFLRVEAKLGDKCSPYRPRFRPRRLVMPVNPSDVHSSRRSQNPLHEKYLKEKRLKRHVERRGVISLASIPSERSVGEVFRLMMETCEKEGLFAETRALVPKYLHRLQDLVQMAEHKVSGKPLYEDSGRASSIFDIGLSEDRDLVNHSSEIDATEKGVISREIDSLWRLLDATPLDSPTHGTLALRGKSLVEATISNMAQHQFPRLRSKHMQQLIHECCGLMACGRVALRTGFADICGVNGEISMWRELNVLTQRLNVAKCKAAIHLQRIEKGVAQQRRWYWRGVLQSANKRLKQFPVQRDDLLPRMEWIRGNIFAYIAFVEMAEKSGDAVQVIPLIKKLFCSQLSAFINAKKILDNAHDKVKQLLEIIARSEESLRAPKEYVDSCALLLGDIQCELTRINQLTSDEFDIARGNEHPLNRRADNRREQFSSSGGTHAIQSLRDDIFDDYHVARHDKEAPPIVLNCIRTQNSLREAQIILRYDPNVPPSLASSPIDVDQIIRKITEVHETNSYATLYNNQQFRQVEYTVCRLYSGKRCIGEGKGENVMEAMNEAAHHTLFNYYLRSVPLKGEHTEVNRIKEPHTVSYERADIRVNEVVDEEIVF